MIERFLIKFAQFDNKYYEFRFIELDALASLFEVKIDYLDHDELSPYMIITTNDKDKLFKVIKRSVGIIYLIQLIEYDCDKQRYLNKLKHSEVIKQHLNWTKESFKIEVDVFNRRITLKDKIDKIEEHSFLPFEGPIDLNNPINKFYFIECYDKCDISKPFKFYFGKYLMDGNRRMISDLSLSNRKFISNTSMDPELSIMMANLAKVKSNDICFDMFAGSGSLMVAIAKFGGYSWGVDIDYSLVHGISKSSKAGKKWRDKDECVKANFEQYKVKSQYLDMIIGDSSTIIWRDEIRFDAIITDPPYSIRESALKIGSKKTDVKVPEEYVLNGLHTPAKIQYSMLELITDLLNFSSRHLNINCRLVFWYPLNKSTYDESDLPIHPNFKIISHAKQVLAGQYLRILITLEKISEPVDNHIVDKVQNTCSTEQDKNSIPESVTQFKTVYHRNRSKENKQSKVWI